MKGVQTIILAAAVFLTGCSSHYLTTRPMVLPPCEQGGEVRQMSTAALVKAMDVRRWTIEGADLQAGLVRGKVCRRDYCISVDATVESTGEIKLVRTPQQFISRKGGKLLQRYAHNLKSAYMKYRCLPPETVKQILGRNYPPFVPVKPAESEPSAGK